MAPPKDKITEIKLNIYPEDGKIGTNETAVLHAEFFGIRKKGFFESLLGNGDSGPTKLQSNEWRIEILSANGGVLSKPFLYREAGEKEKSGWQSLIMQGISIASSKDAVLFTAPDKPGKYKVRLTEGSLTKETVIEVSAKTESIRKGEWVVPPEDEYLPIVRIYAPFIAQETWFVPKADFITGFNYDGNWKGDDNWENLETGSRAAFVYYAVMETSTHWFLHYNFFHPRDYSDVCVVGTCHENDNEGLILSIRKDGSEFGKLEMMETLAHNNVYSFTNERRILRGVHDIDGKIDIYEDTHPIVFIEAGGHGVLGGSHKTSLFDPEKMEFKQNTGVTYIAGDTAGYPRSGNDRNVRYALRPIESDLWSRGSGDSDEANETFENFFVYQPFGGRPATSKSYIAGAFRGRTASDSMAKPFWGWYDRKTKNKRILNTGQWALDPAYAISVCYKWPSELPVSTEYVYNPFLQIITP
ncbi:MAG: hypothetical protein OEM82_12605 [Acidobacteriota bacterium]|nr:hypothetical protein [Acidobacteriota bacterium]MDH3528053.1 hypothetical protein [Acidobacteriota bacterium]